MLLAVESPIRENQFRIAHVVIYETSVDDANDFVSLNDANALVGSKPSIERHAISLVKARTEIAFSSEHPMRTRRKQSEKKVEAFAAENVSAI